MHETFFNKTANNETNINTAIFNEHFKYQNTPFLVKDLYNVNRTIDEKVVNNVNDSLIDLRNAVNKKEIPENEILIR